MCSCAFDFGLQGGHDVPSHVYFDFHRGYRLDAWRAKTLQTTTGGGGGGLDCSEKAFPLKLALALKT